MRRGLGRLGVAIAGTGAALALLDLAFGNLAPGVLNRRAGVWVVAVYALGAIAAFEWVRAGFAAGGPPRGRARVLRTRRLVLRRAVGADVEPMHAILSDPAATRYWDSPAHADIAETRALLDPLINESGEDSDDFILVRKGRVIGMLGARHAPWVGFILAPDCWGQGYAREALAAFVDYMFARGWSAVVAATDERNAAALALLARAGFRETGRSNDIWKIHGLPSNAIHFRIDNPEAAARPAPAGRVEGATR